MKVLRVATMATAAQATTIPTSARMYSVIPLLLSFPLTAMEMEEAVGVVAALTSEVGVGVDEGDGGEEQDAAAVSVTVTPGVRIEDVQPVVRDLEVEVESVVATGWPRAEAGQPIGSWLHGSTRQQPL
jgi:hypothetical protein